MHLIHRTALALSPAPTSAAFGLLGDVSGSSRALRQLREMDAMGLNVTVLQTGAVRAPDALPASTTVRRLAVTAGGGPLAFWRAHRALRRAALATPAALYLASDLYSLPALAAASRRHDAALVYDSRELYTALDSSHGRPYVSTVWGAVERRFVRRADAVLTVGDAIAERLQERYGIDRPTVLHNAPAPRADLDRDVLRQSLALPDDGRLLVLYQGLFREGRGLLTLVDAAREVEGVRLVLVGEGALEAEVAARGQDLGDRLVLHPFVPPDRLAALTPGADLGACLIEPLTESLRLSLPNKLFEYLAAGVPVLASPLPEIRAVVDQGVGILADPADSNAVADALRQSLDPGRRAGWRENAPRTLDPYTWEHGRSAFRSLLTRLLG